MTTKRLLKVASKPSPLRTVSRPLELRSQRFNIALFFIMDHDAMPRSLSVWAGLAKRGHQDIEPTAGSGNPPKRKPDSIDLYTRGHSRKPTLPRRPTK